MINKTSRSMAGDPTSNVTAVSHDWQSEVGPVCSMPWPFRGE